MALLNIGTEGRFSKALTDRMEELGFSIRDVAAKTETTYEHVRKLVKGLAYPSKWMIQTLARVLEMDEGELTKLATADRIEHKFGATAAILGGKDPEAVPIMRLWRKMSPAHQDAVLAMMKGFATMDEENEPHGKKRRVQ